MSPDRCLIRPFAGLRPRSTDAAAVAAPPYDVLSSEEARVAAVGKPLSFLHVSKAEIDLPPGIDHHAPEVYAKSAANFRRLIDSGVLHRAPIGIFRDVEAPAYDDLAREQVKLASAQGSDDDALQALVAGRDTWTVVG